MRTKLVYVALGFVFAALVVSAVGVASASLPADGPNLLTNPGFEAPYAKQCCQTDLTKYYPNTPIDEVQVANGWYGWWLQPDQDPQHPGSCLGAAPGCLAWHRPEWREANCGPACAQRIRSGENAQKYFTFWSVHDAGMYQQVSGITPGARLRFSAYLQAWSTNSDYGPSDRAQSMNLRVGIDPTGGTNPWSPHVVWSPPGESFDAWTQFSVEAIARNSTVTVYTRSLPVYPIQHVDVYVDDASLVVVGAPGAPTSTPRGATTPRPTRTATPSNLVAPEPMPTPAADGKSYYIVRSGDTLTHIAYRFGTTVARLKTLNGWRGSVVIITGQKIVVGP